MFTRGFKSIGNTVQMDLLMAGGRRETESIQTKEEKLKTELAALKARNEYLETENLCFKKARRSGKRVDVSRTKYQAEFKTIKKLSQEGYKVASLCEVWE